MAYGQFGLFECMRCHKVATEDPGILCPDCTDEVYRTVIEPANRQEKLILALCHEAGDAGNDDELIEGFQSNHSSDLIAKAASGDVAALVQLRRDCGLPVLS